MTRIAEKALNRNFPGSAELLLAAK